MTTATKRREQQDEPKHPDDAHRAYVLSRDWKRVHCEGDRRKPFAWVGGGKR